MSYYGFTINIHLSTKYNKVGCKRNSSSTSHLDQCITFIMVNNKAKIKYMSVSGNVLKKIRVGRSEKYFILFFHFILKWCKMQKCGPYLSYSYTKS